VKLSVVLVTRNEADLLDTCLSRLGFEDELIVLDMESTDDSALIAKRYGARVVPIPPDPFVVRVRNKGLDEATGDWVLYLDPDEYAPPGFGEALRAGLENTDAAAFYMPFRTIGFDRTLRYGDVQEILPKWWESRRIEDGRYASDSMRWPAKLCLFRAGRARWPDECPHAHVEPIVEGRIDRWIGDPIEHDCFRSVPQMVEKMVRYVESASPGTWRERPLNASMPLRTLYRHVVVEKWWRDGSAGLALACLFTMRDWLRVLHDWEARSAPEVPLGRVARTALSGAELVHDAVATAKARVPAALKERLKDQRQSPR
jgi:hypothetical protein